MTYYANPKRDLPAPYKSKRVIVYALGLKIYGQIPYILQRKLQAEFISNNFSAGPFGGRIIAPTMEDNYTIVRWQREDGQPHSDGAINALLDWLYTDKGFEVAVATQEFFYDRLDLPNMWQSPPRVFIPSLESSQRFFRLALASGKIARKQATQYLEPSNAGSD